MRTHVLRGVVALTVLLTVSSAPALAQSIVRGKVVDSQGQPVPDAAIVFEAQEFARRIETKTNRNGEYLQVGLQSGVYRVTASKEGVGTETTTTRITQAPGPPVDFTLRKAAPAGGPVAPGVADKEAAAKLQAAAAAASEDMKAGRHDDAIAKFNALIAEIPTCAECYYNIGISYSNKKDLAQAEVAFKKVVELKPDAADAYTALAGLYNAQKKFDLAADASAKASQYSGGAAGGGSAETSYNQGVVFFNTQKFAEAKAQFEAAVKADPNYAPAYFQLGMAAVNLGQFADAVAALEKYLQVAPSGEKAADVKRDLPALKGLVK